MTSGYKVMCVIKVKRASGSCGQEGVAPMPPKGSTGGKRGHGTMPGRQHSKQKSLRWGSLAMFMEQKGHRD